MPQPPEAIGEETQAGSKQGYVTIAANLVADSERILALWQEGLTQHDMPKAKLDWYYQSNPEGTPGVFFLHHGNHREAVGVAAVGQRRMRYGTETFPTGQLVDFVVRQQHRTLFPAMALQKEIRRRGLRTHAILFGLPNPKSSAVFRRVGYQCVGQMVRHVRVLRSAGYLSRHLPVWFCRLLGVVVDRVRLGAIALRTPANSGFRTQWLNRPDSRFDDLWERVTAPEVLMGARDRKFLTWRFVDCPFCSYTFFTLVSTTGERLLAYAVCEARQKTLHVRDFLVDPSVPGASARLWLNLSREAFRLGYASLSLEFLGGEPEQRRLRDAGMLAREQRPLYAAATGRWKGLMQERHWYLTCADEDG